MDNSSNESFLYHPEKKASSYLWSTLAHW